MDKIVDKDGYGKSLAGPHHDNAQGAGSQNHPTIKKGQGANQAA